MTPDRLDALLARALEAGVVPAEASPEERAELEPLLANAQDLRLNAARVNAEAVAAMPTARARFQRHLEQQRSPSPAAAPARLRRSGFFARFATGRTMTFASSAAALGVIALVAILVLQPFTSVETAAALTIDDYVQVQGVVSASSEDGIVTVQAPELGDLEVALSDLTAVSDSMGVRAANSLKPGDPVLVSGVVTAKRAISASNVAVAENQPLPAPAEPAKAPLLKNIRQGLEGTVRVVTLSPDGKRARVLIVFPSESFLVDVDPRSMEQFLAANPGAVGARVRVLEAPDLPKGVFRLEPLGTPTPPTPGTTNAPGPQFENIKGVIVGRNALTLQVRTDRGVIPVVLRPLTSIRFGDSGLTPDDLRAGETSIGYEVVISGNVEESSGRRIIASIIVVVGKAPVRPGQ